jgi:sugar O-acyltransferase (sialic acid O-acetyltransferase NeuD family)
MRLLIAGAGGHGRVVADTAEASAENWDQIAFLDDRYPELTVSGLWQVIGKFDDLARLARNYDACIAAVGSAYVRLSLLERFQALGFKIPLIVHPKATVSRHARLEHGSIVGAGAVVNIGSDVGIGCIINTGATVDHDCRLGAGVHIGPGAHLAGNVAVGMRSWIGIGAIARQGVRIGADVTVGAGALCLEDVRDGVVVVGAPARERSA